MSFPAYPAYKESGTTWLGRIPKHWDAMPFKWQLRANDGGVWGEEPTGEEDTIVLRSTDQTVTGDWYIEEPAKRQLSVAEKRATLLMQGDLVVTKSSGSSYHIGKTSLVTQGVSRLNCCFGNFMQRLRPRRTFSSKLAWYLLNNEVARRQLALLSNSTTGLANLNGTLIGEILVAVPPRDEQASIVNFLNYETARIDALIEEQKRLIELLKEKRQAVISHAVAKGLDPDVPMKDSGVEWLGEVPAHWGVVKASYIGEFFGSELVDDGSIVQDAGSIPVLKVGSLSCDTLTVSEWRWGIEECHDVVLERASDRFIVFPKRGAAIFLNKVNVVNRKALLDPNLMGWSVRTDFNIEFFAYALRHRELKELADISTVPQLNHKHVAPERFPVPPPEEQARIADYLQIRMRKFDNLSRESLRIVELLRERRSALISAAVTGKIDVRDWQLPEGEDKLRRTAHEDAEV